MLWARMLVIDRDSAAAERLALVFADTGSTIETADSSEDGLDRASEAQSSGHPFEVILLDYDAPGLSGGGVLRDFDEHKVAARVILMSAMDPAEVAVQAMHLGAFDFIAKPIQRAELSMRVQRALHDFRFAAATTAPTSARRPRKSDVIIGGSPAIRALYDHISMVAPTDITVAISGESGTGKELVARTIHNVSSRHTRPFVVVNCAAIPETLLEDELFGHVKGSFTDAGRDRHGLFAAADTGTLFLDEIGEMPLPLQAKVLRVLQSQEFRRLGDDHSMSVDVRIITATNRDLEKAVKQGAFRQDLYYRIHVFPIVLPPLRERREDIPLLAHHFLLQHRAKAGKAVLGFSKSAVAKLISYDFPGNVRELENKVSQALVLAAGELIQPEDVSFHETIAGPTLDMSRTFRELKRDVVESFERKYVRALLEMHRGNVAAASRQAGMDRKNLWALAKKYSIDLDGFRE